MPENRNDLYDQARVENGIAAMLKAAESEGLNVLETMQAAKCIQKSCSTRIAFKTSVREGVRETLR